MNEEMLIERLQHDVDHLLDGHTLSDTTSFGNEYHQMIETARLLVHHDMSSESQIQKTLRRELLVRISNQRREWSFKEKGNYPMKTRSKLLAFVGVLATILLTAAALPPVRAFAQEIINQMGPFVVIAQDIPFDVTPADFTPTPLPGGPTGRPTTHSQAPTDGSGYTSNEPTPVSPDPNVQIITGEEALARFNFKMLTPSYVPEGFTLINAPNNNVVFVGPGYINSSMVYTTVDDAYLGIGQSTFDQKDKIPFYVGEVDVTQIKVRGKEAIFVKNAMMMTVLDANGQNITLPVNYLMWEEDGLFFMMQTSKLTQDEVIKIAESLK